MTLVALYMISPYVLFSECGKLSLFSFLTADNARVIMQVCVFYLVLRGLEAVGEF